VACAIGAATAFMMTNPQRAEAVQPAHTLSEAEMRERAEEAVVAAD
jgi:hypothetical protein